MQDGQRVCQECALQVSVCSLCRVLLSQRDEGYSERGDRRQASHGEEEDSGEPGSDRQSQRFSKLDRFVDDASEASLQPRRRWWLSAKTLFLAKLQHGERRVPAKRGRWKPDGKSRGIAATDDAAVVAESIPATRRLLGLALSTQQLSAAPEHQRSTDAPASCSEHAVPAGDDELEPSLTGNFISSSAR